MPSAANRTSIRRRTWGLFPLPSLKTCKPLINGGLGGASGAHKSVDFESMVLLERSNAVEGRIVGPIIDAPMWRDVVIAELIERFFRIHKVVGIGSVVCSERGF